MIAQGSSNSALHSTDKSLLLLSSLLKQVSLRVVCCNITCESICKETMGFRGTAHFYSVTAALHQKD